MFMILPAAILLGLALRGAACTGDHLHARDTYGHEHLGKREYPQVPITPPYRPLVWGDFNVIHTTDTHGWLLGHQKLTFPEPDYSGDLGDFASFVTHMKKIAIEKDVDLLLVDSGDVHDGTGLSDGYPPGGVDAHESNKFLERLPYDVMTIGNHELYIYADTYDMYTNFVPYLDGRSVPVGNRYTKFTTRKGRRITSLGVLYDFTGNDVNTDWPTVFDAVRAVHPSDAHLNLWSHIRDCQQYDGRSMALESGRYMETIGMLPRATPTTFLFTRRYLDQNRVTYEYHTQMSNQTFDTAYGRSITDGLQELAVNFDLSYLYGTAPQDYTINQNPYPSNGSLLSLFIADAIPYALSINNTRDSIPAIFITNSGSQRFNVFQGPFTKNDQLTASPFTDSFLYIPNITFSIANQVLPALNNAGASEKRKRDEVEKELWGRGIVDTRYRSWLEEMDRRAGMGRREATAGNLTLGYVTVDSCPGAGDDTLHMALPYYSVPDFIGSNPPNVTDDTPIDLVFVDFIEAQLLGILNGLQNAENYTTADVSLYSPTLSNAALGLYAQAEWN
ncbi:5'-nucleotidase [Suillus subalutaceus]|uniref:5'-nucleotidase n=1 Tax=Suillus subalutaceus TaxID=48586 RepID=UPI001B864D81|nr:5'-nucleotidase [Suillus subalutaceus]KAG1851331.1 5'-nucleotidase [Suillus subalutaceus]